MRYLSSIILIFFLFNIFYFLFSVDLAFAQTAWGKGIWYGAKCGGSPLGAGEGPRGSCSLCDAIIVAQNIIQMLFEIAVPIAVIMIAWGAFVFMTAGGSEERITKGRKVMTAAVIGLTIALGAWIIVSTILHLLSGNLAFPWNNVSC